jgi:WD40 repeat protein
VSVWEVSTGKELRRFDCKGGSGSFALTPDGKTLAVGTYTDDPNVVAIYLRDAATGRALQECRGHANWVRSLAFSADGHTLVSGSHDKTVRFWDVATGKELRRLDEPDMVMAVALSPDGKTVATTSFHSTDAKYSVCLRDAATGTKQGASWRRCRSSTSPSPPAVRRSWPWRLTTADNPRAPPNYGT